MSVRGWVVRVGAVVAVDGHHAVALVRIEGPEGLVDGDLLVVHPEAMAVRVRVGEEAGLQHRIRRGLHPRDHVRRGKGQLLDLGKIVFHVAVEGEFAKGPERNLPLRPNLGQIEDVPFKLLGFVGAQHLHITGPGRIVSFLNRVEQILGVPIRIFGPHGRRLFVVERLASLVGLAMDLDVIEGPVGFRKLICVARVSVHVTIRVWCAPIGK